MGPAAIVQSSKDLARLLCLFPFCTLHGWLLSCENVLDITDTKALACHRILCVDMLEEPPLVSLSEVCSIHGRPSRQWRCGEFHVCSAQWL